MKSLICLLFMVGLAADTALADQFRIREKKDREAYDLPYAKVRVLKGKEPKFEGRTDKYGRITVKLSKGSYLAEVTHGNTTKSVAITIDDRDTLTTVYLQ